MQSELSLSEYFLEFLEAKPRLNFEKQEAYADLKDQAIVDTNLKSQTLMFTQKYKITQDKINAIITMSYLNPILDKTSKDDVLALSFTPNTLKIQNLEVFYQ